MTFKTKLDLFKFIKANMPDIVNDKKGLLKAVFYSPDSKKKAIQEITDKLWAEIKK